MSSRDVRRQDLEAVRRPLSRAATLPGRPYHDPGIFAAEMERIFASTWICVGHDDEVPAAGDWLVRDVGAESVLVVRDAAGVPRAHYNVCRHRGSRLLDDPTGRGLKKVQCPYHAWTYGHDGRLLGAPLMERAEGFCKDDYGLVAVRIDSWQGFLFINLDDEAAPLAEQLADFPDLSRFHLPELRRGARLTYDVAANWKLLCENYGECYHCGVAHPQLNRISDFRSGGKGLAGACYSGGPMRLNEGFSTMTMSGRSRRPPIPGLDDDDHQTVHYFNLYPTFLLSLHPDYVLTHTLWPREPGRTHVICEWLFPETAVEAPDFDPSDAVEFWDVTNRQDWELCENVQRSVASRGFRPGRYQAGESSVHDFDVWYVDRMEAALVGSDEPVGVGND